MILIRLSACTDSTVLRTNVDQDSSTLTIKHKIVDDEHGLVEGVDGALNTVHGALELADHHHVDGVGLTTLAVEHIFVAQSVAEDQSQGNEGGGGIEL